ncbi:MAG TPA: ATP-binding protein, partial [Myxococcales bacterium]|nr:ATP-binding protein [Myxococcales bacterium]
MGDLGTIAEPRRLADFLRERRDEILAHWECEVRKVGAARNLDRPLLIDHLPQFLEELADYVGELRTGAEVAPPEENSRIHALERLEVGYDLAEVVAEYAVLRRCITELASSTHTPALRSAELPRLHDAIDQAIGISVVRYTAARERTLRALDRISSAALVHHDVPSLLPRTLDAFLETTASVDTVLLALGGEGAMRVSAAVGYPDESPADREMPADGFVARVARQRAPVFVRDAALDPALCGAPECAPGTHALYGVPLTMGKDFLGVAVMGSRSTREFSQEDQFLFRTMVNRLAALIAQSRLGAEVAQRAAEMEAVIESIPDAIYVGDATGVKRANRAALEMLGYHSADQLDRGIASLAAEIQVRDLEGKVVPPAELVFNKALNGERAVQEVVVKSVGSGEDVILRSSAAPVLLRGRIVGAVAVNSDVTARMREEAELRAALEFRDRMLGVLSHDLRNPLGVILTSAELLQRQLRLEGKQGDTLRRVIDNAHRIERMVHDLLDYTRTRRGTRLPLARREADLLALCNQVIDSMQVLHPERTVRLAATGETRGAFDPDRAAQVIANLVSNALRYSPPASAVEITLTGGESEVILEVRNDGPPIAADLLPRLFQPFQRGVSEEPGSRAGLGLGLYIVQQIVDAHGGKLAVRSTPGD